MISDRTARRYRQQIRELRAALGLQNRDIGDMHNAMQTQFYRCKCGRITERGLICPTNMDARMRGEPLPCEAGK